MKTEQSKTGLPFTIWMVAIPIFVEMVLSFSMFSIDTFFLSRISTAIAASVGAVVPIFVIFVLLFMMVAQGGANVAGQLLGAQKFRDAELTYGGTLLINLIIGVLVLTVLYFGGPVLATHLGFGDYGGMYAGEYLKYIGLALLLMGVKAALSAVCMSQGKTKYNLYSGIIVNVLNISLNILFLFVLDMGLYGVILATTISVAISCIYFLYIVIKKFDVNYQLGLVWQQRKTVFKPILAIGIPAAIQPISTEAGMFVLSLFAILIGGDAIAERVFVMNLITLTICWSSAMSIGNQIMISQLYGAKKYSIIGQVVDQNIKYAMAGSAVIISLLVLFSESLLGLFTDHSNIISGGFVLLFIGMIIEPIRSHAMVVSYSLKATGDATYPAIVGVLCTWVVAVPLGYLIAISLGIGIAGIWIALLIDEILRAAINNSRWLSGKWQLSSRDHLEPSSDIDDLLQQA